MCLCYYEMICANSKKQKKLNAAKDVVNRKLWHSLERKHKYELDCLPNLFCKYAVITALTEGAVVLILVPSSTPIEAGLEGTCVHYMPYS